MPQKIARSFLSKILRLFLLSPIASSGNHAAVGASEHPAQLKLMSNCQVQVAITNRRVANAQAPPIGAAPGERWSYRFFARASNARQILLRVGPWAPPEAAKHMLAATFFTPQAPEPDHERFSELRCSKVTLGERPDRVPATT